MILVTGGTGLVGSQIIKDLLQRNLKVRALKRPHSNTKTIDDFLNASSNQHLLEWKEADINDVCMMADAMEGVAEVYHAAALVSFNANDKEKLMKVNVEGTANVVNAALQAGVKKFGYISSSATLAKNNEARPIVETDYYNELDPNSNYGISKYYAEQEVWRGEAEGLCVCMVNPTIVIGHNYSGMSSASLFHQVNNGLKYYTKGVNGFVDVRDVSTVIIALMEKNYFGQRYLLVSENKTYHEVFNLIAKYLNKKPPHFEVKKWMVKWAAPIAKVLSIINGEPPIVTAETSLAAMTHNHYSASKIKSKLNINFIPISDSIAYFAQLYKVL